MTARAEELARMLQPLRSVPSLGRVNTARYGTEEGSGMGSILMNLGIVLIFVLLILLIVHYTITPIFTFGLSGEGILPVSKASDGELIWTEGPQPSTTVATFEKLASLPFTLQMDVFVEETLSTLGSKNRVFLYRATQPLQTQSGPTLIDSYPDSNILCYLKPDTNDLCVSVITQRNNDFYLESAPTILNIPTRQPFRLTITLQEKLLEVYLNGKLQATKLFRYIPRFTTTPFYGTPDMFRGTVRIMNLQYWNYVLTAMQIANAPPALPSTDKFQPAAIQQGTCS